MDWAKLGVLGVEMEAGALYCNAARAGKKALCICSVSDCLYDMSLNMDADSRRTAFTKMMEVALEIAVAMN
jgi:purine-nucleoside phosphorylase